MGGAMSRNKGQRGEREVIDALQPVVNTVYRAHDKDPPLLQRNTLQSDSGGYDIVGLPWFAPEVKYEEVFAVNAWWKQTLGQAKPGTVPVLFYRRNKVVWCVRMYGMLGAPGSNVQVPVTVCMADFLAWFTRRLEFEICK